MASRNVKEEGNGESLHAGDAMAVVAECMVRTTKDPGAFIIEAETEDDFILGYRNIQKQLPGQQLQVVPYRFQHFWEQDNIPEHFVATSFLVIGEQKTSKKEIQNVKTASITPKTSLMDLHDIFGIISGRTLNSLRRKGYDDITAQDLVTMYHEQGEKFLLNFPRFGQGSLREIKRLCQMLDS